MGEGFDVSSAERLGWPPAQRASGSERGGHRGHPPHLNPPPPRGEEVIFLDSIGVLFTFSMGEHKRNLICGCDG